MKLLSAAALASFVLAPLGAHPTSEIERTDPLTAEIELADVDRFATLFERSEGSPTAEQLQAEYLDRGSRGVEIFTPNRIIDADRLASKIAQSPELYRDAIDNCLPTVREARADLRSIYLGLQGALPEARLPRVYVVIGANNSGGTAGPDAQVLGLEVLCRISADQAGLRTTLRHFFAHETVHSLQMQAGEGPAGDALLYDVLAEGAADFIARLVTGEEPDIDRAEWALPREAELLEQLLEDFDTVRDGGEGAGEATRRWVGNHGSPPDGWPGELGYWMGMRIWERYWNASPDKRAALQAMIELKNPRAILAMANVGE